MTEQQLVAMTLVSMWTALWAIVLCVALLYRLNDELRRARLRDPDPEWRAVPADGRDDAYVPNPFTAE